ncbi:MAG: site-specific DNA-methyltransferase [Planctomycetes bacterium]|nr:site-specific DNA-methyltransferase [Planctomycetota bacterium]
MAVTKASLLFGDPSESQAGDFLAEFDHTDVDHATIPQERLDLVNRYRTSLFPWRGQFSPELVELLLSEFATSEGTVADPFAGSGTTLFEAARKGLPCFGSEINPAAVVMCRTVHFVNMPEAQRRAWIRASRAVIEKHLPVHYAGGLFGSMPHGNRGIENSFKAMLADAARDPLIRDIIANTIMRFMDVSGSRDTGTFLACLGSHSEIVLGLPYSPNPCRVSHCDARSLPLEPASVGLVITSPPYINVFNYHQNYRPAMEIMGWDLLEVARSEFGSNRKNRGNRFLTVAEYAVDMLQALWEMRRVLCDKGRIIVVVGRESTVRGVSFRNGRIIAALASGAAGLGLGLRQERKFKTRFGETIYEDILHLVPSTERTPSRLHDFARCLAQSVLEEALPSVDGDVRRDLLVAIEEAPLAQASPIFKASRGS